MWAHTSNLPHLGLLISHPSVEPRLAVNHHFQLLLQPEMSEPRHEGMEGVKGVTGGGGSGQRGSFTCNSIRVGFDRQGDLGH